MQNVMSAVAICLSAVAIAIPFYNNPMGKGVDSYDFTTPASAMKSVFDAQLNGDYRATLELQHLTKERELRERSQTLQIHSECEHQGKKGLFITSNKDGVPQRTIEWMGKDAQTGLWLPSYVSTYNMGNDALEARIRDWRDGQEKTTAEKFAEVGRAIKGEK